MSLGKMPDNEAPKPVSRWYGFDWQYVLKTGRLPALRPVAIIIAAAPIVGDVGQVVSISTTGFWVMWWASVSSLAAFGITVLRCPKFIREYETYQDYEAKGHSHRWLVWSFHEYLPHFPAPAKQLKETIDKGISLPANSTEGLNVVPVMPAAPASNRPRGVARLVQRVLLRFQDRGLIHRRVRQLKLSTQPTNANRDLYLGFWNRRQRYVLTLQENDEKLPEKARELFWMT